MPKFIRRIDKWWYISIIGTQSTEFLLPLGCPNIDFRVADKEAIANVYCLSHNEPVIVFDTGALVSISNDASYFVTWYKPVFGPTLRGMKSTAVVKWSGTVTWIVKNDEGVDQVILTHSYYVPDDDVRLFSSQKYIKKLQNAGLFITSKSSIFIFEDKGRLAFFESNEKSGLTTCCYIS